MAATAVDRDVRVRGAVDVEEGDRRGRIARVDAERARLAGRGDEDVGRLAREPVRHDHPVRVTRREDARRVHVVLARHLFHELPEEGDVVDVLVHRGAAADAAVPRP